MPCRQKHKHKARHHTHSVKPDNISRVNLFPVGGAPKPEAAPEPAAVAAAPAAEAPKAAPKKRAAPKKAEATA